MCEGLGLLLMWRWGGWVGLGERGGGERGGGSERGRKGTKGGHNLRW